jgi:hypothetical protein
MDFKFLDKEAHIIYSWKERFVIFFKGRFVMDYVKLKDGKSKVIKTFKNPEVELKVSEKDKFIY